MHKKTSYNNFILFTIFLSIIVILSLLLVERYFHSKIEETRLSQYQSQQELIVIQTASSLKDFMEHVKLELISMSLSSSNDYALDKSLFSSYHRSLIESISSVIRVDKQGNLVKSTGKEFLTYSFANITTQDFFLIPKATHEAYVSEISNDITKKNYILISIPVYKPNEYSEALDFDGILFALIDISLVEELYLSQIKVGLNGYIWALKQDGTLLTELKDPGLAVNKGENYFDILKKEYPENSANINKMIAENTGSFVLKFKNKKNALVSFTHVSFGRPSWIIALSTPYKSFIEEISSLQQKMLGFFLFSVFLFSLIFIYVLIVLRSKEKAEKRLENAEITLKKLGIKAIPEISSGKKNPNINIELKENSIYLIKENFLDASLNLFLGFLSKGYLGLVICRNPEEIRQAYGLEKTPIIKLGDSDSKESASLLKTKDLLNIIKEFIGKNKNPAILIERLDYIITHNGFEETIRFIQSLKDSLKNNSFVFISVDPLTLDKKQLALLSKECRDISSLIISKKPKLPKDLYEMLHYIYINNKENKIVALKNISREFNITKPTRKKKVDALLKLGFVKLEQRGRIKSLSITPEGASFIEDN